MLIWVLVSVVLVVGVKFFTATKMRDLERRLNRVKDGLHRKKEEFEKAKDKETRIATEEELHSERIRFMKELIHDIQIRLQSRDEPDRDLVVETPPLRP